MLRLVFFLLFVLAVSLGAWWLSLDVGRVAIDWQGRRIETTMAALLVFIILVALAVAGLSRLATWLQRDASFSKEKRQARRTQLGYDHLNRAMVALASNDEGEAKKLVKLSNALLPKEALTHVIAAEAARMTNDRDERIRQLEYLADRDDAAFLGLRGLVNLAREEGRNSDALAVIETAVALRPKSRWALNTRFELEVQAGRWVDAQATLEKLRKTGCMDKTECHRHDAVLNHARAVEADLAGNAQAALKLAMTAHKALPGFSPAALLAGRLLAREGQIAQSHQVYGTSYAELPHPNVAAADLGTPANATVFDRLERARILVKPRRDHRISRLILADAALDADHPAEAREVLLPLLDQQPDAHAFGLMVRLARANGDDPSEWERKAAIADTIDGRWQCNRCATVRAKWTPLCPTCRSFDSFEWKDAPGGGEIGSLSNEGLAGLLE